MDFDRDERCISEALDALDTQIKVPDLMADIQAKMQETVVPAKKRRVLRPVLVAVAIAALLGVTAFAASVGDFDWLMEKIKVPFGTLVEESSQSVESNGIDISIIAKQSCGDMSVLYVTLKDTQGRGIIGKDTQIAFETGDTADSGSAELLYFDRETGIAAYQLRLGSMDGFSAQPLKLAIEGISYDSRDVGEIRMPIDLAQAVANGEHIGEPYGNSTQAPSESLKVGHVADIAGTPSAWVSSIGVLHGYLTVQLGQPAGLGMNLNYNSLRPFLRMADGTVAEPKPFATGFVKNENMENVTELSQTVYSFDEYYFDVDTADLKGCVLCLKGTTRELLKGNWKFDVDFGSVPEALKATADIEMNGVQMKNATLMLQPLGLTLTGNKYADLVDAVVETTDGDVELKRLYADFTDPNENYQYVWQARSAIDMDKVKAVRIDGNRVALH